MEQVISLEVAQKLFKEANEYVTGKTGYIAPDSEIRMLAVKWHHKATILKGIDFICAEIFRVLAYEFSKKEEINGKQL
jgi:hypothetical protein